jgi:uncharacterized membrane protein YfcA
LIFYFDAYKIHFPPLGIILIRYLGMFWLVDAVVVGLSFSVFFQMYILYRENGSVNTSVNKWKLAFSGFVANVADTLGLGSFAVLVAFNKSWKLIDDKKLPGTLNGQSVLPAMLQSLLFLQIVEMDILTLVVLVLGAGIGGLVGGYVVARLDKQAVRLAMCLGFVAIAFLVLSQQMELLPLAGQDNALSARKLPLGFLAMVIAGMLPSIGVGIYAPTQGFLFLLGLSPLVAYPIMTTIGVIAQSVTSYAFVSKNEIALKETMWITFPGIIGVIVAVPLVTYVDPVNLRWLLFVIVTYNAGMIWKSYQEGATASLDQNPEVSTA